jgi:predicted N-acetyltransferase YhbS
MKLRIADGDALARVLEESHGIWADGLSRQAYVKYNLAQGRTPWGSRHLRRFVLLDGKDEVLSSAKRYDLRARLDGRPIKVVGIAAVFTPEQKRGRGYGRALIEQLLEAAELEGAELAMLFSEIDPDYYEAVGFVPVRRRETILHVKEKPGAPALLVRSGEDRDIPAVTALARSMAEPHRFALEPSEDLVRFSLTKKRLLAGLLEPDLLQVEFFVVEEGAGAVAFAILTTTSDDVILEMCGDKDPSGARVGALLQVLRARTPAERSPKLAAFLPPGWLPPQLTIESTSVVRDVMMVRPLRDGVLRQPLREPDVLYWHGDVF